MLGDHGRLFRLALNGLSSVHISQSAPQLMQGSSFADGHNVSYDTRLSYSLLVVLRLLTNPILFKLALSSRLFYCRGMFSYITHKSLERYFFFHQLNHEALVPSNHQSSSNQFSTETKFTGLSTCVGDYFSLKHTVILLSNNQVH